MSVGRFSLQAGNAELTSRLKSIAGTQGIELHAVILERIKTAQK